MIWRVFVILLVLAVNACAAVEEARRKDAERKAQCEQDRMSCEDNAPRWWCSKRFRKCMTK
jgi:hypothetical protein